MSTAVTLFALGVWTLTGMFFGLVGSLYGAVRGAWRLRGSLGFAGDFLLACGAGAITFLVLVGTDWGVLRVWTVLAILAGYLSWTKTLGDDVYRLTYGLLACLARFVRTGLHVCVALVREARRTGR
jgi:hypothetical protein